MCDNGFIQRNIDNYMTVRKDTASGEAGDDSSTGNKRGYKKSLPSCMKTATVTKGRLSGTDKGRAAIIEGKKKSCYKTDRMSKQKNRIIL